MLVLGATLGVVLCLPAPHAADHTMLLRDVAAEAGLDLVNRHGDAATDYVVDANGNGAAWFDYDGDGDLDTALVDGSTLEHMRRGGNPLLALYRNEGGGRFSEVTGASGLTARGWGMGICVADYDNDGADDMYVTAFGPNVLYQNDGHGGFDDVSATAGVGDTRWSTGCAFGDYDRDGDVDLYVANHLAFDEETIPPRGRSVCKHEGLDVYCGPRGLTGEPDVLYRNDGNGRFTDVTREAGIADPGYYGFAVLFSDLDGDLWPDIFVANDSVPNLWFRNNRDGTFADEGLTRGLALNDEGREQAAMGAAAGDITGDGLLDLVVTNFSEDYNTLYAQGPPGLFTDASHRLGLGTASWWRLGWGVGLVDLDNDGRLDLFVANGHVYPDVDTLRRGSTYRQANQVFRNRGKGRFEEVSAQAGPGLSIERSSRGAAFGDYDDDGDVDVLVVNMNDRPTLLRNDSNTGGHWASFRLVGTSSNRNGIGARVRVTAGGRTQVREVRSGGSYLSHNDLRVHVGLGGATRIDGVEIQWPSGAVDTIAAIAVDTRYDLQEGAGRADAR